MSTKADLKKKKEKEDFIFTFLQELISKSATEQWKEKQGKSCGAREQRKI